MKKTTDLQLGDIAKCTITGFHGVVVAITYWLNGCVRATLQSEKLGKDGQVVEPSTFDAEQLVLLRKGKHAPEPSGGPQNDRAALRR